MEPWSPIDTLAIKSEIERKFGDKATEYFDHLSKFPFGKMTYSDFRKRCIRTIGKENVRLHNCLISAILQNQELSDTAPPNVSNFEGALSVRKPNEKGDCSVGYRLSPLGPNEKSSNIAVKDVRLGNQEKVTPIELDSSDGGTPVDEEFDQLAGSHYLCSRSPIRAPLGVHVYSKDGQGVTYNLSASSSRSWVCRNTNDLPDTMPLEKSLEQKLEEEGLKMSADCADLINKSLQLYLKRLIKPCLDVAMSCSGQEQLNEGHYQGVASNMQPVRQVQRLSRPVVASMSDFQATMELNPSILGHQWPTKLEKIAFWESQNQN